MPNPINITPNTTIESGQQVDGSIGRLLLQLGKITPTEADKIAKAQQEHHLRFGDAAMKLGLITQSDISQVLALQFDYPYLQPGQGDYSSELIAAYEPFTPQVEALRALRSQIMMRWFNEGYRSLAIVGANQGEGTSRLAANLAIVFSQLGQKTLLIDANLRNPSQHQLFNLKEKRGLSDILAERADMSVISKIVSFVDLSVLGAGTIPPNPQELLGRPNFSALMKHVVGQYDIVLVDTTPTAVTMDAQATIARCGGALLVSRLNHTKVSDVASMRDQILATGATIVGAVINEF
ncbi:MAG: chain length determinant protein tyrosine kinase EpsG [Sulfuriferula sp.]